MVAWLRTFIPKDQQSPNSHNPRLYDYARKRGKPKASVVIVQPPHVHLRASRSPSNFGFRRGTSSDFRRLRQCHHGQKWKNNQGGTMGGIHEIHHGCTTTITEAGIPCWDMCCITSLLSVSEIPIFNFVVVVPLHRQSGLSHLRCLCLFFVCFQSPCFAFMPLSMDELLFTFGTHPLDRYVVFVS